ncbi:MAG: hypothetical protein ACUVR4_03245 [Anaerolineae bacterium]
MVQSQPGAPALFPELGQQRTTAVVDAGGLEYTRSRPRLIALQVGLRGVQGIGCGPAAKLVRGRGEATGGQKQADKEHRPQTPGV